MSDRAAPPETVTLTIDAQTVTVPRGTTLLEAAERIGTRVPHYCYHPGLSAPAMCRLCLVEVEGAPKLQPSCVSVAQEGQVVLTESENAVAMRRGVLEFYLVNHPLDCPICDQSGECKLQDYVFAEGRLHGRSREPKRVFGRDDFGGDVLFYGDRCVMCTRCVRFMNEVEQDPRLTVVERGDRAIIDTFFDEGLENTYFSGNVVDICPVGALVSKDFLFKQRAWDLDHTPSVCPNCSQGCNIELHTRDNLVQRMKPRENADVNGHWMCDYGRLTYEWINRGDRVEVPLVRAAEAAEAAEAAGGAEGAAGAGGTRAMGWGEALSALVERLRGLEGGSAPVRAVASPFASNEDLAALAALVEQLGGGEVVYRMRRAPDEVVLKGFPALARRRDLAPNARGAEILGMTRAGDDEGAGGLDEVGASEGVVLVLGDDLADQSEAFGASASLYVYLGTHGAAAASRAHFVLPVTSFAEQEGTFTNVQGRVQRFWPALEPPGAARPAWLVLGHVLAALAALGGPDAPAPAPAPASADQAFSALAGRRPEFEGIRYPDVGTRGALINEPLRLGVGGAGGAGGVGGVGGAGGGGDRSP